MNYTPQGEDKLAYDIDSLRNKVDIGRTKIFEEVRAGRLKARRFGGKLIFLHQDVVEWLGSLPERAASRWGRPHNHGFESGEAAAGANGSGPRLSP